MLFLKLSKLFLGVVIVVAITSYQVINAVPAGSADTEHESELPSESFILKRPPILKEEIQDRFNQLLDEPWNYNGQDSYVLFNELPLEYFLRYMINHNPERKNFYLMDIGAGDFRWAKSTAKVIKAFIEKNNYEDKGFHFHIIGLTGNKFSYEEYISNTSFEEKKLNDYCTSYFFSSFPIENMEVEFKKRGLRGRFNKNIDFIVSNMTFVHFNDPLGDFIQACNFLRPKTGLFSMDGFQILSTKTAKKTPPNKALDYIKGIEYLQSWGGFSNSKLQSILVRRTSDSPILPSFIYSDKTSRLMNVQGAGQELIVPIFNLPEGHSVPAPTPDNPYGHGVSGSEKLYKEILVPFPSSPEGQERIEEGFALTTTPFVKEFRPFP